MATLSSTLAQSCRICRRQIPALFEAVTAPVIRRHRPFATTSTSRSDASTSSIPEKSTSSAHSPTPVPAHIVVPQVRQSHALYDLTGSKKRMTLDNMETARAIVKSMKLEKRTGINGKGLTVIDLYAGKGLLSKALLELPNVERVIAVENVPTFIPFIEDLVETNPGRLDLVALDPFWWDTYAVMKERKLLEHIQKTPWESGKEHPQLVITGMIPDSMNGERLLFQQLSCVPDQIWLYDYGRFPSYFLVTGNYAKRISAQPNPKERLSRHKLAVLLQAMCTPETLLPAGTFSPQEKHFTPLSSLTLPKKRTKARKDVGYALLNFTPLEEPLVKSQDELDVLEYLTRNLFVHGAKPWTESMKFLAAGAEKVPALVVKRGHTINPKRLPRDLTQKEWRWILEAWMSWPFRPVNLEQADLEFAEEEGRR